MSKKIKILGIIPARYESTRFPGKVMVDINDMSMVQRVYEQANKSAFLSKVIIATESKKVKKHVESFGGEAILTSDNHIS
ncbi:3-deoxy-manno-octulosonate cytidylyltransferase, partial [hydrothermal vent metagenome]